MTEHDGARTESATDELRRMLDERGVEWTAPNSILRDDMTSWVANGFDYDAFEVPDGTLVLSAAHQDDLTPEQAIAATLGAGTCHNVHEPPKDTTFWPAPHFKCSECGEVHVSMQYVFYCPNCGRKVVDPTTNDVDAEVTDD
jgi:predicted RNA-binding Zn-ribbon protein involved in translation (DUF1610 family)